MNNSLRLRTRLLGFALTLLWLTASCSRETVSPSGAITGALAPVSGLGSATSVTATAADGHTYTATPDAQTGNFSFATLPPGAYVLTFTTSFTSPFSVKIPVTVVAGTTVTPEIPPLTHDNVVRGQMRWTLNGKTYSATEFGGQLGPYFYLSGAFKSAVGAPAEWNEVFLVIPEADKQGKIFAGTGNYPLGVNELGSFGEYTNYAGGVLAGFSRYSTYSPGTPAGTVTLTRYDAQKGVATGNFEFVAAARANTTGQVAVTNGSFDITF